MKMLWLPSLAIWMSATAVTPALAQGPGGTGGTGGSGADRFSGQTSAVSFGSYGPGFYGPGATGPGATGPGAYGAAAYVGSAAGAAVSGTSFSSGGATGAAPKTPP
jgi:hypothetical protein